MQGAGGVLSAATSTERPAVTSGGHFPGKRGRRGKVLKRESRSGHQLSTLSCHMSAFNFRFTEHAALGPTHSPLRFMKIELFSFQLKKKNTK